MGQDNNWRTRSSASQSLMIDEYGFLIEQMHRPSDRAPMSDQQPPADPGDPFNGFFLRWEE